MLQYVKLLPSIRDHTCCTIFFCPAGAALTGKYERPSSVGSHSPGLAPTMIPPDSSTMSQPAQTSQIRHPDSQSMSIVPVATAQKERAHEPFVRVEWHMAPPSCSEVINFFATDVRRAQFEPSRCLPHSTIAMHSFRLRRGSGFRLNGSSTRVPLSRVRYAP